MKDAKVIFLIVMFVFACIMFTLLGEWLFPPETSATSQVEICLKAVNAGNAACDKGDFNLAQYHYRSALDCEETRTLAEQGIDKCSRRNLSGAEGSSDYAEDASFPVGSGKMADGDSIDGMPVFKFAEEMPEFPGGKKALFKFLNEQLRYPPVARQNGIEGTVYVGFIVETNGIISNVKVERGLPGGGGGCDREAMHAVKSMPRWKPGWQNGKAVAVAYTLPIKFTLGE